MFDDGWKIRFSSSLRSRFLSPFYTHSFFVMMIARSHRFPSFMIRKTQNNQWWIMTIHPPASGSSQPFAGARHTAHTRHVIIINQFFFLFFLLLVFFLMFDDFFLLSLLFFLESRRRRFHITRARSPCFILFLFFFDFIASPLVRTGHPSRGSQQQHALTFIHVLDGYHKI